jgi:signal transduction histidine kinase
MYQAYIHKGLDRMNALISNTLKYSEIIGNKRQSKKTTDTNIILQEVLENIGYPRHDVDAKINVSNLPTIKCNPTQINQLFSNLISNAIKFRSDKPLVIDIFAIEHKTYWEFHVIDNGIGIPESDQSKIFNLFERLHSKEEYEGTGIGLATCMEIVKAHNGKIYVQDNRGSGSDFVFTLKK